MRALIGHLLAALVAGAVSFAVAAVFAFLLATAVWLGALAWRLNISPWGPLRWPLAILATGLVLCATLAVLFGTAARLSAWLRIPPWFGMAVAGVFGGVALHWLLFYLTSRNYWAFGIKFPYWWIERSNTG